MGTPWAVKSLSGLHPRWAGRWSPVFHTFISLVHLHIGVNPPLTASANEVICSQFAPHSSLLFTVNLTGTSQGLRQ